MAKKYIYDKYLIETKGIASVLKVYDEDEFVELEENEIEIIGDYPIDSYFYYHNGKIYSGNLTQEDKLELYLAGKYQLQPFEKIVENKIIVQPHKYTKWNNDIQEWVDDLELAKHDKREQLKTIRYNKIYADLEVENSIFQMSEKDIQNFIDIKVVTDSDKRLTTKTQEWILKDNTTKTMTAQEIINVYVRWILRKGQIFGEFTHKCNELEHLTDLDSILKFKWE